MSFNIKKPHKTKRHLMDVLGEMLKRASLEDITIKAIVQEAGITRSTFYTHYQDKYALFEDLVMQCYQKMYSGLTLNYQDIGPSGIEQRFYDNYKMTLEALYKEKHIFGQTTEHARNQIIIKGVQVVKPLFIVQLGEMELDPAVEKEYLATFFLNGLFSTYNFWISDHFSISPEVLSKQLTQMTMSCLYPSHH